MSSKKNQDEITLKELILKILEFKIEIFKNWKLILLIAAVLSGFMFYSAITATPVFKTDLTFMVSEDSGGSVGGMSGLLGQFGLGGGRKSNPLTMLELLKTRRISEKVLFKKTIVDGKNDFLANHIINNLDKNNEWFKTRWPQSLWEKTSKNRSYRFKSDSLALFSRLDNSMLKSVILNVTGSKGDLSTQFDDMTGIMKLNYSNTNEKLALDVIIRYYDELRYYYYNQTIEKQKSNYLLLQAKTDSIANLLNSKEYQLANFKDSSKGLISRKNQLTETRLYRDVQKLNMMYIEVSKNLEIAEFSLNIKKPIIQLIDKPVLPLSISSVSKLKNSLLGFGLGLFLASIFIIFRKIILDALLS